MELFFDTETTALALFKSHYSNEGQPSIVQLGMVLSDKDRIYAKISLVVNPGDIFPSWSMSKDTEKIHGISGDIVKTIGVPTSNVLTVFNDLARRADTLCCHNVDFDFLMIRSSLYRAKMGGVIEELEKKKFYCTMKMGTSMCKLPGPYGYKWPKLVELHKYLFNEGFEGAHDALNDVLATRRCYYKMIGG